MEYSFSIVSKACNNLCVNRKSPDDVMTISYTSPPPPPPPTTNSNNNNNNAPSPSSVPSSSLTIGALQRYPYMVSLQKLNYFCGGSLIAPDLVLSSAHCVENGLLEEVVINPYNIAIPQESTESFGVVGIIIHPFYKTLTTAYDHDLSIIKMNGFTNHSIIMRLNTDETLPKLGSKLQVVGWGGTSTGTFVTELYETEVQMVTCAGLPPHTISSDSLCATGAINGICSGHGGSPLIIPGSTFAEDIQVGLVSWSMEGSCEAEIYPHVYAGIEEEYGWIRSQVCSLSNFPPDYFECT
mmetsp:Transcript_2818/g.4211  ORF Transcript_2818/g.4211 Transcript_2818/m.4211 type:complete len:296 (+) Transcript_2818:707-1594(+)